MNCIEFEGQTHLFRPPDSMPRGSCGALPVLVTQDGRLVSVWKPDAGELAALAAGAHVLLHIFGGVHPPVALTVQKMQPLP